VNLDIKRYLDTLLHKAKISYILKRREYIIIYFYDLFHISLYIKMGYAICDTDTTSYKCEFSPTDDDNLIAKFGFGRKGISSGPTHPADANGPFWSVCVEGKTHFASRSGPPGRRAQRVDASYPAQVFLIV
jgi:hypothetical protein